MKIKTQYIVLGAAILISLIPILYNPFFVTLDGPSHLYNARLLLDFVTQRNLDFWNIYYRVNPMPDTNWFSHLALGALLPLFKPFAAERILQALYVILFILASYLLVSSLNKKYSYGYLALLPFVYNHTFQMGFYNYSFGVVFMMLSLWLYLSRHNFKSYIFYPAAILLFFETYLAHLIGFMLLVGALSLYLTFETFLGQAQGDFTFYAKTLFKKGLKLLLVSLPGLLLVAKFFYDRRGIAPTPSDYQFSGLSSLLLSCSCLITVTSVEQFLTTGIFISLVVWVSWALWTKFKNKDLRADDSFLIIAAALFIFYYKQPGSVAGAGIVPQRVLLLPFLFITLWVCSVDRNVYANKLFSALFAVMAILLFSVRMPILSKSSDLVSEILTCQPYISERSTVLALDYAPNGIAPDGNMIADRIWMYFHIPDYLGAVKPLVMLNNYEANISYFPVNWQNGAEPFHALSKCNDGIQEHPPCVNLMGYKSEKHKDVNYVLLIGLTDPKTIGHPNTQDLLKQLSDNHYELIYTSANKRAKLYHLLILPV